jgi:uncharacterized DUF497 family protein
MQFEWDEAKNLENIRKHQIDFQDVYKVFDSPMLIEEDERFDYGEERWFGIGFLGFLKKQLCKFPQHKLKILFN